MLCTDRSSRTAFWGERAFQLQRPFPNPFFQKRRALDIGLEHRIEKRSLGAGHFLGDAADPGLARHRDRAGAAGRGVDQHQLGGRGADIDAAETQLHELEERRARFASGDDTLFRRAIDTLSSAFQREDLLTLYDYARATATAEDRKARNSRPWWISRGMLAMASMLRIGNSLKTSMRRIFRSNFPRWVVGPPFICICGPFCTTYF